MKNLLLLLLVISVYGCKNDGIPPDNYSGVIELALEDIGTTDAWLRMRFTDAPPYAFRLERDGEIILTINTSSNDTLVADEQLLPNRSYTYKAYRLSRTSVTDSSRPVQATTLDTTSHAWQWALDTLGAMNSYLLDCAVISKDDIWVVGVIYARDSLGDVEDVPHNAAHWNGKEWELQTIYWHYQGRRGVSKLNTVFSFSPNDVWVASSPKHWDGKKWKSYTTTGIIKGETNKIWGQSSFDLYFVGNKGSITHFDGQSFERQESGTVMHLTDVFGTSTNHLYISGSIRAQARGVVLEKTGQGWQTMIVGESNDTTGLFQTKLYGAMEGLWIDERGTLYTVGNLMYQYEHGTWNYVPSFPGNYFGANPNYLHRGYLLDVQGIASNDMFICGQINTLRHFNGFSWAEIGLPYHPLISDLSWYSVSMKSNTAVAVGSISQNFGRGVVIRMWR